MGVASGPQHFWSQASVVLEANFHKDLGRGECQRHRPRPLHPSGVWVTALLFPPAAWPGSQQAWTGCQRWPLRMGTPAGAGEGGKAALGSLYVSLPLIMKNASLAFKGLASNFLKISYESDSYSWEANISES